MARSSSTQSSKRKTTPKKTLHQKPAKTEHDSVSWRSPIQKIRVGLSRLRTRISTFRGRRPHRSFRLTRRRDYVRSLKLPGYWAFTFQVLSVLKKRRMMYLQLAALYAILVVLFGGMTSQATYTQIGDALREGGQEVFTGNWGRIAEAGILSITAFTGSSGSTTDVQQVYFGLFLLMTWLTTIWLLREQLAGRKPRLRDGLYNASSPLVSTVFVALLFAMQLLPFGLLAIAYSGLVSVGIVSEGFGLFIASAVGIVAASLTLYWLVSTFFALVVVALPGMYPWRAVSAASDLVVGRRLRLMYRLLWMLAGAVLLWLAIIIPSVLLVNWLQGMWGWLEAIPVVPFVATLVSSLIMVGVTAYIYLLYRKVVDDDAAPA